MPDIKKDNPIEKGQPGKNIDVEKDVGKKGMEREEDLGKKPGQQGDFGKQGSSEDKGYTRK